MNIGGTFYAGSQFSAVAVVYKKKNINNLDHFVQLVSNWLQTDLTYPASSLLMWKTEA